MINSNIQKQNGEAMGNLRFSYFKKRLKNGDFFETMRHSKNYFGALFGNKAIAFFSIPIFTRLMTTADYGITGVFSAYLGIFPVILSFNSFTSIARYYYEKKDDFREFVGTTLLFSGGIFAFSAFLFFLFYKKIKFMIQLPGLLSFYLLIASLFLIIYSIYNQILVPQKKSSESAVLSIAKSWITFIVAIILVYLLKENRYLGQIWAQLIIGAFFSIYLASKISRYCKFAFKAAHIKYIFTYSGLLIPYTLSGVILSHFDVIMVKGMVSASAAGLYSLGYNVGELLLLVTSATQTALIPDLFRFYNNKEYGRLNKLTAKIFSVITISALGLIMFAREMVMVLADKKFHPGLSVVSIVVIGYVFHGMFTVYSRYIVFKGNVNLIYVSIITLLCGILNIMLNVFYIPRYGYLASAYITVFSYFCMFFLTWIVTKIILRLHVTPLWCVWKPTLMMFLFIVVFQVLNSLNMPIMVFALVKAVILGLFCIIVFNREIWGSFRLPSNLN